MDGMLDASHPQRFRTNLSLYQFSKKNGSELLLQFLDHACQRHITWQLVEVLKCMKPVGPMPNVVIDLMTMDSERLDAQAFLYLVHHLPPCPSLHMRIHCERTVPVNILTICKRMLAPICKHPWELPVQ